jgi:hypothetical protein
MGVERARNVLTLLNDPNLGEDVTIADVIDAVRNHGGLKRSKSYLMQECQTCFATYPSRMVTHFIYGLYKIRKKFLM